MAGSSTRASGASESEHQDGCGAEREARDRVSSAFLEALDFVEGIRAAVVDKDRCPRWSPARLSDVHPKEIARFFTG